MTVDRAKRHLLDNLFVSIDEKNTDRFLRFLTDDAVFRFGSAASVEGQAGIRKTVDEFFATIAASRHVLTRVLSDAGTIICEGEVTYTRHDNSEITLPFANVFEFAGELIAHYKIYADAGPLYEA